MEDSVGEAERREQEEAMAQGKKRGREEEQDAGVGRVVEGKAEVAVVEEGGFLSSMASKIGVAMSGTNGGGGAEDTGEGNGNGHGNALAVSDGDEEKADGNGIFHKLLSSSSPSPSPPVAEEETRGGKDEDEGGGGGGGEQAGILSAMASKIGMAMSGNGTHGGGDGEDVDHSKGDSEVKEKQKGGDEPSSNGTGIVKQIMSNLPTSDTRGPDAEEASLLISIIDD